MAHLEYRIVNKQMGGLRGKGSLNELKQEEFIMMKTKDCKLIIVLLSLVDLRDFILSIDNHNIRQMNCMLLEIPFHT